MSAKFQFYMGIIFIWVFPCYGTCRLTLLSLADSSQLTVGDVVGAYSSLLETVGDNQNLQKRMLESKDPFSIPSGVYLGSESLSEQLGTLKEIVARCPLDPNLVKAALVEELKRNIESHRDSEKKRERARQRSGEHLGPFPPKFEVREFPEPAQAILQVGDKVFVSGKNNLYVWNVKRFKDPTPDFVIPQNAPAGGYEALATDGTRLFAARPAKAVTFASLKVPIDVWQKIPTSPSDLPAFTLEPRISGNTFSMVTHQNRLLMSDWQKNTVFGYSIDGLNAQSTSFALMGLPTDLHPAYGFFQPNGLASDGTNLLISDGGNNRLVVFDKPLFPKIPWASFVIGQPDQQSGQLGTSPKSFTPNGASIIKGKLFVPDPNRERILVWDSVPTKDGVEPDHVLGQRTFLENSSKILNGPQTVVEVGDWLVSAQLGGNDRKVFVFDKKDFFDE